MGYYKTNRDFHEARWDEPIIMKLGNPGERGVLVPKADEKVTKATGTVETLLPENLIRKKAPKLPEMSQMQVLRHYMRYLRRRLEQILILISGLEPVL